MRKTTTSPPDLADIEALAREAAHSLPDLFRAELDGVLIRVEDFPDDDIMREMELESPFDLLGLYSGIATDRKSVSATPQDIDMIFLYRRPILDYWCETHEPLERVVRHVLIHEVGHHLGLSDAEMDRIERDAG